MNQEVMQEINGILSLLEARLPGSLENTQNAKLERDLEKTMAKYFDALDKAMPDLSELYSRNVEQ